MRGLPAPSSSAPPTPSRPRSTGERLQGPPSTRLAVVPEEGLASQRFESRSCKPAERTPVLNGKELSEVQASKKATFVSTLYSICTGLEVRAPIVRACKAVPAIPSLRARTTDLPSVAPRRALLSSTHPTPALKLHPPQHVSPPPYYS